MNDDKDLPCSNPSHVMPSFGRQDATLLYDITTQIVFSILHIQISYIYAEFLFVCVYAWDMHIYVHNMFLSKQDMLGIKFLEMLIWEDIRAQDFLKNILFTWQSTVIGKTPSELKKTFTWRNMTKTDLSVTTIRISNKWKRGCSYTQKNLK